MKKLTLCFILSFLTISLLYPARALAEEGTKLPSGIGRDQIGQKIQDFVKEHEKTTAGMATAVFDANGTIYQGSFGYMDKKKGIPADDESVFEWGSVTKLTIWVSVMQLWEEGKIDLEEDIRTYLPEGFLRNLRYEKPISMLDLMNHQAGFDEAPLYMKGDKSLEELLFQYQPIQSFEPGTTTAYSNYGTGIAAYIVERISGQSYVDYVHMHIFEPLGMNQTAILPDLSDNNYVAEKRKEDKGYDTKGKSLGASPYEVGLYPAGRATGTLNDMQKFAKALLSRQTLFKRSETWMTLYSPTTSYPGTDTIRNAHGFWANEYSVSILGHGGMTSGFSSRIMLDLKHGIGCVIMTNQKSEQTYNFQMPELVFGPRKTSSEETQKQFRPGYYRTLRTLHQGPVSIYKLFTSPAENLKTSADVQRLASDSWTHFWTIDESKDNTKLLVSVSDYEKISAFDFYKDYVVIGLGILGSVYGLGMFLISLLMGAYQFIFRKNQKQPAPAWKIWNLLTAAGIVAVSLNFFLILTAAFANDLSAYAPWRYMVFAGLGLLLTFAALLPLFRKSREKLSKAHLFLTILTSLSALAIVANIPYWSLYQWWLL